jgi:hypothetical protein
MPARDPSFINPNDYLSEASASSEVETREVDPMDELSDFESQTPRPVGSVSEHKAEEDGGDVDMGVEVEADDAQLSVDVADQEDEAMEEAAEEEDSTVCAVCRRGENEDKILICDGCESGGDPAGRRSSSWSGRLTHTRLWFLCVLDRISHVLFAAAAAGRSGGRLVLPSVR